MAHKKKSFYRHILWCKKGFSLIESSLVLAIAGCFLSTVIYQGAVMMEKAQVQNTQKDIVQYALYISQWKSDFHNNNAWEELSENGLDEKNIAPWQQALQEGVFSQKQINAHHKVPSLGKGAYLSVIRQNNDLILILGAIKEKGTNGPVFTQTSKERLLSALRSVGLSVTPKQEGNKYWLQIFVE